MHINQLIKLIEREYNKDISGKILDLLIPFGSEEKQEKFRISNAILKLSRGNTEDLLNYSNAAKSDWRDVLAWAEYPMQTRDSMFKLAPYEKDIGNIYTELDRFQFNNWLFRRLPTKEIINILDIGVDTTFRGKGISLKDALIKANYTGIRKNINRNDIMELVICEPQYLVKWIMYSEDKRTNGGYALIPIEIPKKAEECRDQYLCIKMINEIGDYVLKELDFWNGISG